MISNRTPATVTFVFLAAFAAWFVADRYVDVAFYRLRAGEALELGLAFLIASSFLAVIGASVVSSWRARAVEWAIPAAAVALLLTAEMVWRFIIAPLPMNGFKVAAAVMDVGTPVVGVLGLYAAITEWRHLAGRGDAATA